MAHKHKTRHGVRKKGAKRKHKKPKKTEAAPRGRAPRRKRRRHHAGAHRAAAPPVSRGSYGKYRVPALMQRSTWAEHEVPYKLTQMGSPPFGYDKWNIQRLRRAARLTEAAELAEKRLNVANRAHVQHNFRHDFGGAMQDGFGGDD